MKDIIKIVLKEQSNMTKKLTYGDASQQMESEILLKLMEH